MKFHEAVLAAVRDGERITRVDWPRQEPVRFDPTIGFCTNFGAPVEVNQYAGGEWETVPRSICTEEAMSLLSRGHQVTSIETGRKFMFDGGIYSIGPIGQRAKAGFSFEELCGKWRADT